MSIHNLIQSTMRIRYGASEMDIAGNVEISSDPEYDLGLVQHEASHHTSPDPAVPHYIKTLTMVIEGDITESEDVNVNVLVVGCPLEEGVYVNRAFEFNLTGSPNPLQISLVGGNTVVTLDTNALFMAEYPNGIKYDMNVLATLYRAMVESENQTQGGHTMFLTTGIYAMGDARFYSRIEMPDLINALPTTDQQIIDAHQALAGFTSAKLIAVTKSILYDPTEIPESDPEAESRIKILIRFANGNAKQVEVPAADTEPTKAAVLAAIAGKLFDADGSAVSAVIKIDTPPERKARGK